MAQSTDPPSQGSSPGSACELSLLCPPKADGVLDLCSSKGQCGSVGEGRRETNVTGGARRQWVWLPAIQGESLPLRLRFPCLQSFLRMLNNPALPTSQRFIK
ncbi:unnamed protein product [Rangifer tarandus platyrhynchus]|uniref:Uncharacterized protein n=1 Tax=Rangifer tarandus platyrhynchus TaxID=3082113 RepID=A0AC59YWR3_RANTA